MSYTQGVVLGIVQGLTEFLPVSSSGHLILVPHVFGWPDQGLAFDAVMHLGTLGALLAYFHRELLGMARGTLSRRVGALLILATVPAALVGVLFESAIEARLRSPLVIATTTAFWGIVMWIADRRARAAPTSGGDPLEHIGWAQGLAVGTAQALSLVPGTSRSGITITTGLLAGIDRATAARFSFLLGILITGGAGAKKALTLFQVGVPTAQAGPLAAALVAALVSGWLAVWFLVSYLRRGSLTPFVIYRLILAAVILVVWIMGGPDMAPHTPQRSPVPG
ncbi:MAG: undecaprenyl-diphosphate phosphatase [Candidatus Rokubacteria bacterium]|nr:undecaprenyl-diphosphate phosphatase [Candidatus Rokubacteria bacterium]